MTYVDKYDINMVLYWSGSWLEWCFFLHLALGPKLTVIFSKSSFVCKAWCVMSWPITHWRALFTVFVNACECLMYLFSFSVIWVTTRSARCPTTASVTCPSCLPCECCPELTALHRVLKLILRSTHAILHISALEQCIIRFHKLFKCLQTNLN